MDLIRTSNLIPGQYDLDLYHHSGELLHQGVHELTPGIISSLLKSDIKEVYAFGIKEKIDIFLVKQRFDIIDVSDLPVDEELDSAIYGDHGILLRCKDEMVDQSFIDTLQHQGIVKIFKEKLERDLNLDQVKRYFQAVHSPQTIGEKVYKALSSRVASKFNMHELEEDEHAHRRFHRFDLNSPAAFKIRDSEIPLIDRRTYQGVVTDISQSGLGIICNESPVKLDDVLDVIIMQKDGVQQAFTVRVQYIKDLNDKSKIIGTSYINIG